MQNNRQISALSIAGSDSSGGAGIQVDLRTFENFGVHPMSVISALTAQSPLKVNAVEPVSESMFLNQLQTLEEDCYLDAIKVGMLYDKSRVDITSQFLNSQKCPIIIDPVCVSTSGHSLLLNCNADSLSALLSKAELITPNITEAEFLSDSKIMNYIDQCRVTQELANKYKVNVLLKGGHGNQDKARDTFCSPGNSLEVFIAPWINGAESHGTGCTLSSAIAASRALGEPLHDAIKKAKDYVWTALNNCKEIGPNAKVMTTSFKHIKPVTTIAGMS
ncbi:MAG: bifunctional hydroxymethylpyrimidine kinase/phosphomethylpyrimidine kinase [Lentisphaeria bacterium]|nr:bifunctional hydroxymethylpyrimidine kinase/phosphomethylpyrimidine kinase [Lentisphaeria bacterium]